MTPILSGARAEPVKQSGDHVTDLGASPFLVVGLGDEGARLGERTGDDVRKHDDRLLLDDARPHRTAERPAQERDFVAGIELSAQRCVEHRSRIEDRDPLHGWIEMRIDDRETRSMDRIQRIGAVDGCEVRGQPRPSQENIRRAIPESQ